MMEWPQVRTRSISWVRAEEQMSLMREWKGGGEPLGGAAQLRIRLVCVFEYREAEQRLLQYLPLTFVSEWLQQ